MTNGIADDASARPRLRILTIAYACCPVQGSEKGVGWGLVRALARFSDPVVLVGAKYGDDIRHWQEANPHDNVRFIEVPEPAWERKIRRRRVGDFIGYIAWLRRAKKTGLELLEKESFDIACHATYSTYWLPSPVSDFGLPSVLGPVGGAVQTPVSLWPILGWRGILVEWLDFVTVRLLSLLPATRRTLRKASVCLALNDETMRRLPPDVAARTTVLNHILLLDIPYIERQARADSILYVSPLESRKGTRLALLALATTPEDVKLCIVGDGPERKSLERLARKLGCEHRVEFTGNIPRTAVFRKLARAPAVLFTGTREEGGVSLGEALLSGAPVIVLANGGPVAIASQAKDFDRVTLIPAGRVADTAQKMGAAMIHFSRRNITTTDSNLNQENARGLFKEAVDRALATGVIST